MGGNPRCLAGVIAAGLSLLVTSRAVAQQIPRTIVNAQANAVNTVVVQGVEQAISNLPPAVPQSADYRYDASLDTYVPANVLGPTAFLSPNTQGAGNWALGARVFYQDLSLKKSSLFNVSFPNDSNRYVTKFGLRIGAPLTVVAPSIVLGITNWLDISLVTPITIIDLSARTEYITDSPTGTDVFSVTGATKMGRQLTPEEVLAESLGGSNPSLFDRSVPFSKIPGGTTPAVNEGTHAGLGRVQIAAKALLPVAVPLAFSLGMALPSPNQDQYSGSDSFAIYPRLIGAVPLPYDLTIRTDVGYEYDVDVSSLRRFSWNTGLSYAQMAFSMDGGIGGSLYNTGIRWAPQASTIEQAGQSPILLQAQSNTNLGANLIDLLWGAKVRVSDAVAVTGNVLVPITNDGLHAAAAGAIGVEVYF